MVISSVVAFTNQIQTSLMCYNYYLHNIMQDVIKELTPNFQGYHNFCDALAVMKEVANDINETQRLHENSVRTQVSMVYLYIFCIIYVHKIKMYI